MKVRNLLEGIGAALLLAPYYLPFLPPGNHAIYHHGLPITNVMGGFLLDLIGISILSTGFLVAAQHLCQPMQRILEALFAGLMLWSILGMALQVMTRLQLSVANWIHLRGQFVLAVLLLSGVLAWFLPRHTQLAVRAVRLAVAAFAFSSLWIVPQLLHLMLIRPPVRSPASAHLPAQAHGNSRQRIIWILFDELSYDQTFDHRAPGIRLPNFDRLRAQSLSFSNLKPVGYLTNRIIPSLISGNEFHEFRSTIDGQLSTLDESQHRWIAYDPNATLFGVAQRKGWNSGVDGWFIPYCNTFAPVLHVCYWYPGEVLPTEEYGASEGNSMLSNAAAAPNQLLAVLTNRAKTPADIHMEAFRYLMANTQALIDDNQIGFVFLHLPVPHPPGIYDRQRHLLRSGGTYLDNLVLADDVLGVLMKEIDATPSAGQTTVIVSSDHSWRLPLWRPAEGWSGEEERASEGKFDDRPVLLIHFPRQASSQDVNAALPEMLEHEIIADMLNGKMNNPEDLEALLSSANRSGQF
jgi:hypothetical protein